MKRVEDIPRSGERTKLKDDIRQRIENLQNQRTQGGKDLPASFETVKSNVSPDEIVKRGGITPREQQVLKDLGRENDAIIKVRPRGERPGHLIETGQATPKGPDVHVKTVKGDVVQEFEMGGTKFKQTKYNPEVEHLGYDPNTKDLVVCRQPDPLPPQKPPDMSAREWRELRQAHADRMSEFINERPNLEKLVNKGKIKWDPNGDAIVYDAKTNLPQTSDIDGWMIQSNKNPALPVPHEVEQRILSDPRAQSIFQHGPHAKNPVSGFPRDIPADSAPGTMSPFENARRADLRIIESAADKNKGLISFDGKSDTVDIVKYTGPKRNPYELPN